MVIMQAKAVATVVQIICPYCDEPIIDDSTESTDLNSDTKFAKNPLGQDIVICRDCGRSSTVPKTARLFTEVRS